MTSRFGKSLYWFWLKKSNNPYDFVNNVIKSLNLLINKGPNSLFMLCLIISLYFIFYNQVAILVGLGFEPTTQGPRLGRELSSCTTRPGYYNIAKCLIIVTIWFEKYIYEAYTLWYFSILHISIFQVNVLKDIMSNAIFSKHLFLLKICLTRTFCLLWGNGGTWQTWNKSWSRINFNPPDSHLKSDLWRFLCYINISVKSIKKFLIRTFR